MQRTRTLFLSTFHSSAVCFLEDVRCILDSKFTHSIKRFPYSEKQLWYWLQGTWDLGPGINWTSHDFSHLFPRRSLLSNSLNGKVFEALYLVANNRITAFVRFIILSSTAQKSAIHAGVSSLKIEMPCWSSFHPGIWIAKYKTCWRQSWAQNFQV